MRLQILDLARDDLIEGFHFYEDKEDGLGGYFLTSLYSDIESLKVHAGIHPQPHDSFYRALSKRFPFAVFYSIDDGIVRVHAVVDCRRHP